MSFYTIGTGSPKKAVSAKKVVSAKKAVSAKKPQKRKYVTTHELQQKQKQKFTRKSPELGLRMNLRSSQDLLTSQQDANAVKAKGAVRRKLDLQKDSIRGDSSEENDSITELPAQPARLTKYEEGRIVQMQVNEQKLEELGIKKLVGQLKAPTAQKGKGKEKAQEECDDYIPENEEENDSDETSERIKNAKKRKLVSRPQTRSRVNATPGTEAEKEVTSSSRAKLLKPTCSKLLKQSSKSGACGRVSDYLEMRDRQKQGMLTPTTKNVQESNLENIAEEETEAGCNSPKSGVRDLE
ncbi:hypothetical protein POM88_016384 [Heracleum sosnowskyi]|uniref:Uncharacterized protein n=1 Tax=Heracleum sosnowskyi TaxID=360622 RepID=A0AAD8IMH5_9APIA|nr:hypothetical protein POM88_016384 [Heracleum sosnowskyi]